MRVQIYLCELRRNPTFIMILYSIDSLLTILTINWRLFI